MTSKSINFFPVALLVLMSLMSFAQGPAKITGSGGAFPATRNIGLVKPDNVLRDDSGYDFYTHPDKALNVPFASVTSSDGFTFIAGTGADYDAAAGVFLVICVNDAGELVWEKRMPATTYSTEYGMAITLDNSGNLIVSGIEWNGHDADMLTLKLDTANGDIIWQSSFSGPLDYMEVPIKIVTDGSGNILIAGVIYTGDNTSWITLKFNDAGSLLWYKILENALPDSYIEPMDIQVSADGNVGVTGYHGNSEYYQCYYTIVYSEAGEILWSDLYEQEGALLMNSLARGITSDDEGNWYVTGILNTADPRMHTIKYDQTGNVAWEMTAAGEWSQGSYIKKGAGNLIYVAGRHFGDWVDDGTILIAYDTDGTEVWTEVTNDLIDVRNAQFTLDSDGNPVISGWGYDSETFDNRLKAIRYDVDGNTTGEWVYNIPNTGFGNFNDYLLISSDAAGDIYMTFNSYYTELGGVFEVAKSAYGNDGFEWDYRYSEGIASAIELLTTYNDDQNNTYLTGMYDSIIGTDLYRVYVVSKYNSTGSLEWEKLFSPLNENAANGIQMRVAANGDAVIFLGAEYEGALRIKKLNTNGDLMWEKEEMPGSTIYDDFTLDEAGNYILAGSGEHEGTMSFIVRKISADGEELWTAYDRREGFNDELHSVGEVVTDASGNIYVTGKAGTGGWISQETDITVLKYSPSGELLWLVYFPEEGMNTVGKSVYVSETGDVFVNGYIEDRSNGNQQMMVMRLDESGNQLWKQNFMESGRRVNSYNTRQLSNGDIIVSGFSVIDGLNNKIILVKYDEDGNFLDLYETEFFRFYRDVHVDKADNYYLYAQMTSSPYPLKPYYSAGAMPLGTLVKLTSDGNLTEEFYYGPGLSDFYPCMLLPMNDGRLLMSGKISNEFTQFGGLYFFETEHVAVGTKEPGLPEVRLAGQAYPNPAKELTVLPVTLDNGAEVTIEVIDVSGRLVMVPYSGYLPSGLNQVKIDVSMLEKGMYIYAVSCGEKQKTGKIIVK